MLTDTFFLRKSFYYQNPKTTFDPLPIVYGDLTTLGSGGVWVCPCIDTVNFLYMIADHPILSVADGNTITVYKDGSVINTGFSIVTSGTDENGRTIAYLDFTSDQGESVISVRAKGKAQGSTLIENPLDVVNDFLTQVVGFTEIDPTSYAIARQLAEDQGYKAAGVMLQDQSPQSWLNEILSNFLIDFWMNQDGKLVFNLDLGQGTYQIAGILQERHFEEVVGEQRRANLVNQVDINYAYNYVKQVFEERDNGEAGRDVKSQNVYGKYQRSLEFRWVRSSSVVNKIEAQLVSRFKDPVWVYTVRERGFQNAHVERGDYVLFSWEHVLDERRLPLQNQICRVLGTQLDLDAPAVTFNLIDTGQYLTRSDLTYNGAFTYNGERLFGGERRREVLA